MEEVVIPKMKGGNKPLQELLVLVLSRGNVTSFVTAICIEIIEFLEDLSWDPYFLEC